MTANGASIWVKAGAAKVAPTRSGAGTAGFRTLGYVDEEIFTLLDQSAQNLDEESREAQLQAATTRIAAIYFEPAFGFFNIFTVKNNYVKDFFGGEWTLNLVTDDHNVWINEDER